MEQFKYCPKCRGELEGFLEGQYRRLKCTQCGYVFYQNSKPCVTAVVMQDNKVLLGKRAHEPVKGTWDLLGGFLETGEHPEDGMRRELREETGLEIKSMVLLGMFVDKYPDFNYDTLNIAYLCKVEGTPKANDDVEELKWFDLGELPKNLSFKNTQDTIESLKQYLEKH